MVRKLLPFISLGYTVVIIVLSLATISDISIIPDNNDKVNHAIAHFIFVGLWFLSFYFYLNKSKKQALKMAFISAFLFGIVIEILQHTLTESRQADYKDVIANVVGALIAVLIINLLTLSKVKND
ncbi:VanZ like family protein [Olleya namhaensis]|uniref:VanZ like family protein n=1 Tax=Olleya namhaensis TaxID=1144750 RepID=A0A1I3ILS8_9FLAO|nr:VanZ like family protein [Olleya namhaensis]